jgi:two-component system invasion response regulator UvrY
LTKRAEPDELIKAVRLVDKGRSYIEPSLAQDLVMSNMSGEQEPLDILSPREFEVFAALADGFSVKAISSTLNLSPKTVGVHRTHIMKKLDVDNLSAITRLAIRHGVITA